MATSHTTTTKSESALENFNLGFEYNETWQAAKRSVRNRAMNA